MLQSVILRQRRGSKATKYLDAEKRGEGMLRIAVVEDNQKDAANLLNCIQRYGQETGSEFFIKTYPDGINLIEEDKMDYDIVFLDIEMSHMDGMNTARNLRERDSSVCIIFVTNISKYAIQSYEVNAFDYVMKPVQYSLFGNKMKKAIGYVELHRPNNVWIGERDNMVRMPASDIAYVQKDKNYLIYHTKEGEYRERGTLSDSEKKLPDRSFVKVNSGCLVNLLYVTGIGKDTVHVMDADLPVSRQQKKVFQEMLIDYIRDGVGS